MFSLEQMEELVWEDDDDSVTVVSHEPPVFFEKTFGDSRACVDITLGTSDICSACKKPILFKEPWKRMQCGHVVHIATCVENYTHLFHDKCSECVARVIAARLRIWLHRQHLVKAQCHTEEYTYYRRFSSRS